MNEDCVLTSIYNLDRSCYEVRIDKADPVIWIADELLHQAHLETGWYPAVTVRKAEEGHGSIGHSVGEFDCWVPPGHFCFHNAIVTMAGINRTVIYRVDSYDAERHAWRASWPD